MLAKFIRDEKKVVSSEDPVIWFGVTEGIEVIPMNQGSYLQNKTCQGK